MTASVIATVGYVVDTKAIETAQKRFDELDRKVSQVEKSTNTVAKSMANVGTALKGFAALGIISSTIQAVISNTLEMEKSAAMLDATLKSTGRYTPELSAAMKEYAGSLQTVTIYGDDAIVGAQALLLKYTQIAEDTFPKAQEAILDVASALDKDLNSATKLVGKALNDPIKGLNTLRSIGITFTDSQKELIKSLVETGDVAGAQSIMLAELETRFGGAAEAARDTLGGAIAGLKNAFGDLLEGDDGSIKGAKDAVNDLAATLSKPETKQSFAAITTAVLTLANAAATALSELVKFTQWVGEEFAVAVGGIAADDVVRLTAEVDRLQKKVNQPGPKGLTQYNPKDQADLKAAKEKLVLAEQLQAMDKPTVVNKPSPSVVAPVLGGGTTSKQAAADIKKQETAAKREADKAAQEKKRREEQAVRDEQTKLQTIATLRENYALTESQRIEEQYTKERELAQQNVTDAQLLSQILIGIETEKQSKLAEIKAQADDEEAARREAASEANKTSFDKWLENTEQGLMSMEDVYSQAFDGMTDTLTDFVMTGKLNFADFARSIIASIVRMTVQMLLFKAISGFAGITPQADGAFSKGVQLFAKGGVVNRPTGFAHSGGMGVMGEAGPEAIMPLTRGKDGKLGVAASGGGGSQVINISTNVNIAGNASKEDASVIGQQVANAQRQLIRQELANQSRSGNMLNPGLTGY